MRKICARSKQGGRLFVSLLLLFGLAAPALAIEYSGIGGRPAFPREDNPRTSSIFVHTLNPGESQEEGVNVINNTSATKTILVYGADSTPSTDGVFACEQLVQEKEDVGAWINLEKTELTLASGESEIVPFTIDVPANASVGEHNGCILIQEKKDAATQAGVNISTRLGLRVAVTIPGEIFRQLEITGFTADRQGAKYIIRPEIKNTGNVSVDTNVQVKVVNLFGGTNQELGGQYPVFRGESASWNFEWTKPFWGGWYRAKLLVEYDASASAGVGVQSGGQLTQLQGQSIWLFSMPAGMAWVIYLLVLIFVVFLVYILKISRKRSQWMKSSWIDYRVGAKDDLKSLADKHHVSWKLIAKANKLVPPYTLSAGQTIKVPPKEE